MRKCTNTAAKLAPFQMSFSVRSSHQLPVEDVSVDCLQESVHRSAFGDVAVYSRLPHDIVTPANVKLFQCGLLKILRLVFQRLELRIDVVHLLEGTCEALLQFDEVDLVRLDGLLE